MTRDLVTVRSAVPEDAAAVAAVHIASWRAAYPGLLSADILDGLDERESTQRWRAWLEASCAGRPTDGEIRHSMFVAERDGRVVGWVTSGPGRDDGHGEEGEIAGLYAAPERWSSGVGRALVNAAQDALTAVGFRHAYLWVLRGNDRAIAFYERQGWAADGGLTTYTTRTGESVPEQRHSWDLG